MQKKIALITLDSQAVFFYALQIKDLFGDIIEIDTYNIQDRSAFSVRKADLYVISTDAFESSDDINKYLPLDSNMVEIRVTFTKQSLRELLSLQKGTRAMFVNLSSKMAIEGITRLNQLGVNNIEFVPVYPDTKEIPRLDFAITPGEKRYVPPFVTHIMDIGPRVLDAATIVEIALKLDLEYLLEQSKFKEYFSSIADNSYNFNLLFGRSIRLESQLEILMSILDEGIIGVNEENNVFVCSPKVEQIIGIKRTLVMNRPAKQALPFIPFDECCKNLYEVKSRLIKIGDTDISLSVTPVIRGGKYIGGFAVVKRFSDEEYNQHKLRMQLMHKGHKAKYTFDSIIGNGPSIKKACDIAKKMAVTNGSILITGESGSGKELFAHAIHNHSSRRDCPFVAINCAAIPDNLLESELFGYEEGAFTGAKRGGKLGLFEFAHKGTLFLDEIEGMSSNLQIKLLRVIQEKEVLRVGGNKIISVDVRVIAATNEDIADMVEAGSFRKDLYYRLNTLPIVLPPLREREDDIMLLFERMKIEFGGKFMLSPEAEYAFLQHNWSGNVRELRNYVEYLTYMNIPVVNYEDLPPALKTKPSVAGQYKIGMKEKAEIDMFLKGIGSRTEEYIFILTQLWEATKNRRAIGRKAIAKEAERQGFFITEQEIRALLLQMDQFQFVKVSKGRGGSKITEKGLQLLKKLN
ncbi:sigma 54-interacting transcriptional regulator [Alkaliphilus peptidifermentans]|uniref:Transcriptional regulator containing PAS, AAA-type ATPase, and DNA-binding Fis domains n=1 Tax=Alkaliphilus peptidifermentans DSM 18978 TaxID=1120976 RepID=A0A1G5HBG0_9FIRM|nr:sigma 54-interacting transcriptional regulator [Alkaliphilus peptidifermentans]SCY61106.1 Transcriptional regulator containing PAS, AAA-type ATPase, and DNA-binding Fis domains [Alkaliphilus peptidifermentans DSM 18978]